MSKPLNVIETIETLETLFPEFKEAYNRFKILKKHGTTIGTFYPDLINLTERNTARNLLRGIICGLETIPRTEMEKLLYRFGKVTKKIFKDYVLMRKDKFLKRTKGVTCTICLKYKKMPRVLFGRRNKDWVCRACAKRLVLVLKTRNTFLENNIRLPRYPEDEYERAIAWQALYDPSMTSENDCSD